MTRIVPFTAVFVFFAVFAAAPAAARSRHHRVVTRPAPSRAVAEAPRPSMFYPEEIEGGVSGNLPFNNQIRKHTDGLNANGGR